jgi:hypothetical protein
MDVVTRPDELLYAVRNSRDIFAMILEFHREDLDYSIIELIEGEIDTYNQLLSNAKPRLIKVVTSSNDQVRATTASIGRRPYNIRKAALRHLPSGVG